MFGADYNGLPRIGAVYIYILQSSTWTLSASFVSPSTYLNSSYGYATGQESYLASYFGANVAVFGSYAIVGAPYFSKKHRLDNYRIHNLITRSAIIPLNLLNYCSFIAQLIITKAPRHMLCAVGVHSSFNICRLGTHGQDCSSCYRQEFLISMAMERISSVTLMARA